MAKYFSDKEFKCNCCSKLPEGGMDERLINVLDAVREVVGVPLVVTSGYRCPSHNAAVGGVPNSQHVQGIAADIAVPDGMSVDYLADIAERCGADGIGRYYEDRFVHIDTRGYEANW